MASSRFLLSPVALLALALTSCAPSPQRTAIRAGAWDDLRASVLEQSADGRLDIADLRRLSGLISDRALRLAPEGQAVPRIKRLRACASSLTSTLRAIAKGEDAAAGSEAARTLYEAGLYSRSELAARAKGGDPHWRAALSRSLILPRDGESRREAMVDADERVRVQALRAAMHALDPDDIGVLLEAARLDPNQEAREAAIRAAGTIGGERVVLALRDLYPQVDEADRRAIVEALGMPKSLEAGGQAQLIRVAQIDSGSPAILAGATLVRLGGEGAASGLRALLRSIREGTSIQRARAIRLLPLNESTTEVLRAVADDPDTTVRIAALARLTESTEDRSAALEKLSSLAEEGDLKAASALVRSGDTRAQSKLVERLGADDPKERATAAKLLIEAGEFQSAAPLLGDSDANVRIEVACGLLSASK